MSKTNLHFLKYFTSIVPSVTVSLIGISMIPPEQTEVETEKKEEY